MCGHNLHGRWRVCAGTIRGHGRLAGLQDHLHEEDGRTDPDAIGLARKLQRISYKTAFGNCSSDLQLG